VYRFCSTRSATLVVLAAALSACSRPRPEPKEESMSRLAITSPAFAPGDALPARFTCDGEGVSPPLLWTDPPEGTKSFALIVDDPDAPDPKAPKTDWTHWVLYDMPPEMRELPEGASEDGLPAGVHQGLNDWKRTGYGAACPPKGRHRYVHTLFALDTVLPDLGTPSRQQLLDAMKGHVLAEAELIGTYERR
jgi:Raf kinase inhibitor-like YbhB/YbcL family protein